MTEIENSYVTALGLKFTSERTQEAYMNCIKKYLRENQRVYRLSKVDIWNYLLEFKAKYSISYYNQMVSALKILYTDVLKQPFKVKSLKLLKQPDTLCKVMSPAQIGKSISRSKNIKHKAILLTLFQTGIRVSELLSIKLNDINSESMTIHIHKGKGSKDRYVPLSEDMLSLLRTYWKIHKPSTYLFESTTPNKKYSASSLRNICKRVGINNPHLLRHSIITHLIDSGDQQTKVQMFAGHKSPKSTLKYYHIAPNSLQTLSIPTLC